MFESVEFYVEKMISQLSENEKEQNPQLPRVEREIHQVLGRLRKLESEKIERKEGQNAST